MNDFATGTVHLARNVAYWNVASYIDSLIQLAFYMNKLSYPECYLASNADQSGELAQHFSETMLETQVWVVRLLIAFAAIVTVWRMTLGLPVYSASIREAWLVNGAALFSLVTTLRWRSVYLLQYRVIRLLGMFMLLVAGFHMVATSGFEPIWVLTLMLIGSVICGDEPNHPLSIWRWLGTAAALITLTMALYFFPLEQRLEHTLFFKRVHISMLLVVAVTAFSWHYIFYLQSLIGVNERHQYQWHERCALLIEQNEFVNPLFLIVLLSCILMSIFFSTLFWWPESSFLRDLILDNSPLLLFTLCLMAVIFLLAIRPQWKRQVSLIGFWVLAISVALMMSRTDGRLDSIIFIIGLMMLQYIQPLSRRWLAIALICLILVVVLSFKHASVSLEFIVIGFMSFSCCALLLDRLRQLYRRQLKVLQAIHYASQKDLITAEVVLSEDANWFKGLQHWILFAVIGSMLIVATVLFSYHFNMDQQARIISNDITNEISFELDQLGYEFHLLATIDDVSLIKGATLNPVWCALWRDDGSDILQRPDCQFTPSSFNLSVTDFKTYEKVSYWLNNDRLYLVFSERNINNRTIFAAVDVVSWLNNGFHLIPNLKDFNVVASFWLPHKQQVFSIDLNTMASTSSLIVIDKMDKQGVEINAYIKPEAAQLFYLEVLQWIVVLMVLLGLIRRFYLHRQRIFLLNAKLHNSNLELETNKELRQELSDALFRTEQANKARDNFLGMIGHEIRTPLNVIMGMIQALSMKQLPSDAKHLLENAYNGSTLLLNFVNDVLDYNKIRSGQLFLDNRPFVLASLVDQYVNQYKVAANAKGLNFKYKLHGDSRLVLLGDDIRLGQVLSNLLNNAVKFTDVGGIILQLDIVTLEGKSECTFKVIDTGVGIEPEFMPHLFESFKQSDMSMKRKYRGSGLGLSIAKNLAEQMHGHIDVVSRVGRGSTFIFKATFDLAEDQQFDAWLSGIDFSKPDKRHEGERILVVDDDSINLEVIAELMVPFGVEVDCASTAEEALEYIQQHGSEYRFVLMDHQMPHLTGLEQTYNIRETYAKDALPIILLTADLSEKVQALAQKAGTNESIAKPITLKKLLRLFETY